MIKMIKPIRLLALLSFPLLFSLPVLAQSSTQTQKVATASISGRVTVGGKPLPRVPVVLSQSGAPRINNRIAALARTTTDEDGNFRLTNLEAGKYTITPVAPPYIVPKEAGNSWEEGKLVTLAEGDTVEDVEIALRTGGVITGRIVNANNQPLIETTIRLHRIDERGVIQSVSLYDPNRTQTDDRGIYRIYGLPAGRYKVSVGFALTEGFLSVGTASGIYRQTFYPGVTDEASAEVVEVVEGGEVASVDIATGLPVKSYSVRGRIIDAATGKPLPNMAFGYGTISQGAQGDEMGSMGMTSNRTNAKGEFIQEGVLPGRFAMFAVIQDNSEAYSDTVIIEVKDADVTGLEIKVRRGASLSGTVVIEGASETEARELMSQFHISYAMNPRGLMPWRTAPLKPAPDGTFSIKGLRAGKVQITPLMPATLKNVTLMRVEHNGADLRDGVEVKEGEPVTGVRVVMAYGTGVVRGQVTFEDGAKVEGARYSVILGLPGGDRGRFAKTSELDAAGRFLIEGVPTGEYELALIQGTFIAALGRPLPTPIVIQKVTVENGAATQTNFVVKAGDKDRER